MLALQGGGIHHWPLDFNKINRFIKQRSAMLGTYLRIIRPLNFIGNEVVK